MQDSITPITNAPTPVPTGGCDTNNGYFKWFNKCYKIGGYEESDRYKWKNAREVCEVDGGTLVGIHNKEVESKEIN